MTLRDNILFAKPYVQEKYDKVLEMCAMNEDLKVLPGGDKTEIGERVGPIFTTHQLNMEIASFSPIRDSGIPVRYVRIP